MKKIIGLFAIVSFPIIAHATDTSYRDAIRERITPVGQVNVDQAAAAAIQPAQIEKPKLTAQSIYKQYCSVCHVAGVAGAPRFQNAGDWKKRNKKLDEYLKSVTNGLNAMPAMGTCVDCTQDDLKAAIKYMLPK